MSERNLHGASATVVSFAAKRKAQDARTDFLNLIDADLQASAQPIPQSLLDRARDLCEAIDYNESLEAREG